MNLRLVILTTGRQDWGMLRPLCEDLHSESRISFVIWAGGMACDPEYSHVSEEIVRLGLPLSERIAWDVKAAATDQASDALREFGEILGRERPDALILLGDRFETCAAAVAATLNRIPIVHLYGGEETEGAFDNALRHAISKLSHLHFVANPVYARRLVTMGENPDSIHVAGLLSLDLISRQTLPGRVVLEQTLGVKLESPIGLVTLHPTTLGEGKIQEEFDTLLRAMREYPATWIVSLPNSDPGGIIIRDLWCKASRQISNLHCFHSLGEIQYWGIMKLATVVIGNSSSGLTEAPFFGVPSINLGSRQDGRLRSASVVDVPFSTQSIVQALKRTSNAAFRDELRGMVPAYGGGAASRFIIDILLDWTPPNPPIKLMRVT